MLTLLFVALGILTAAAITTALAFLRAKDGYEDASGFHFGVQPAPPPVISRPPPEWLRHLYAVFKKPVVVEVVPKNHPQPSLCPAVLASAETETPTQRVPLSIR